MINKRYIVAAIDFGPDTERIVGFALYYASLTGAGLILLHVIDYLLTPPSYLKTYLEEERKKKEREISRWSSLAAGEGVKTEQRIMLGQLLESFRKMLRETDPDLLVIGYKTHIIRPSSSERILRSLDRPMLVVRGTSTAHAKPGAVQIKTILCPVDFSENSQKAVVVAREHASLFKAGLHLVHIIPTHRIKERGMLWQKLSKKDREEFEKKLHGEAYEKIVSICQDLGIDGGGEIFQGNPGEIICSVAEERKYDLIVMGARGASYLRSLLVGSITESVLKAAPCAVLVVH